MDEGHDVRGGEAPVGILLTTPSGKRLHEVVVDDVRRGGLPRSILDEVGSLSSFYLDEAQRERLRGMGRVRSWLTKAWWLLRAMLLRLTPARRALLLGSVVVAVLLPRIDFGEGNVRLGISIWPFVFVAVLLVLMLELKDKLVARDEIEIARDVQTSLLPKRHPEIAGWTVWSVSRAANDVGGDLVDYVPAGPGRVGVVLGDVAGKGMGAALLAAKLQATLRALVPYEGDLGALASRMNGILTRDGLENRYATAFYAEIEEGSPVVRWCNAGHNPPLRTGPSGSDELGASAPPLGMLPGSRYVEERTILSPGDRIVAFSDGITEAVDMAGREFGENGVRGILAANLDPEALGRALLDAVERHQGPGKPRDDQSVLILRYEG